MSDAYTTVIGLEVHVQLATQSKLFCRCSTRFGAEPNTQTCPVCIGMPGTLPVMNRKAFYLALKTAVALNCEIPKFTKWDRKQYYYPDLPKGYQISQFDLPMSETGHLEICDPKGSFEPKRIGIIRAHLEEDAGKSVHDEVSGKGDSQIDLNRTGTPLLEIVSEPDLRSSLEARIFLDELKLLLTYLGVSDCNMQEGSLRVDANVNLHIATQEGTVATPIVEIKNMNSFRAVERALDYEAARQYQQWQETRQVLGSAPKQTRGWDEPAGVTRGQRSKEESSDYRYLPDPDLVPVTVTDTELETLRKSLEELPAALRGRLTEQHNLTRYDAEVLVNHGRPLVDYFLKVVELGTDGKSAANWVTQDVLRLLKERDETILDFNVPPHALAELIAKIKSGDIPSTRGREVFEVLSSGDQTLAQTMDKLAIVEVNSSDLSTLCETLLADNPKVVADVQNGKLKAIGALIGQAKQKNPNV
ncbi:MAG: Asp-tRNA(Asn)/Glu-tRNA(Gln) amidotransferase subunit GatB, partial [Pirellulales bacterium]|nr:Asp-tRNA(Asn)/Glu-tRNA(Gln) amidotransferase subunit GatB [Pirellulales bacterium]